MSSGIKTGRIIKVDDQIEKNEDFLRKRLSVFYSQKTLVRKKKTTTTNKQTSNLSTCM